MGHPFHRWEHQSSKGQPCWAGAVGIQPQEPSFTGQVGAGRGKSHFVLVMDTCDTSVKAPILGVSVTLIPDSPSGHGGPSTLSDPKPSQLPSGRKAKGAQGHLCTPRGQAGEAGHGERTPGEGHLPFSLLKVLVLWPGYHNRAEDKWVDWSPRGPQSGDCRSGAKQQRRGRTRFSCGHLQTDDDVLTEGE
jgi:hypothetical protein